MAFHGISMPTWLTETPPGGAYRYAARVTRRRCQAGDEAKQVGP